MWGPDRVPVRHISSCTQCTKRIARSKARCSFSLLTSRSVHLDRCSIGDRGENKSQYWYVIIYVGKTRLTDLQTLMSSMLTSTRCPSAVRNIFLLLQKPVEDWGHFCHLHEEEFGGCHSSVATHGSDLGDSTDNDDMGRGGQQFQ